MSPPVDWFSLRYQGMKQFVDFSYVGFGELQISGNVVNLCINSINLGHQPFFNNVKLFPRYATVYDIFLKLVESFLKV